jgi:serine/threonine protein kinase
MPDLLERLSSALGDRYAIEREAGRGGMATVFLAEDRKHHRQVAIKVLHPELAATIGSDRFLREIQIAAKLEHPHILALIDSGEADGLPYYVMPYVEGESLRDRLEREGQLPIDRALGIAGEVADGLDYAHRQGVVHRDIKPGNILLAEKHARIADFGVARALGAASEADATATGLAVGTPKYMSPEQAAGGNVDGRSDVYALGCVLYEMLAGDPPFDGPTPQAILARKAVETAPELQVRRKTVPQDLETVVARAMAAAAADRYPTAGEFAEALKAAAEGRPVDAGAKRPRRGLNRAAIAGVAAGLVLATVWGARQIQWRGEESGLDPELFAVLPFSLATGSPDLEHLSGDIPQLFSIKLNGEFGPRSSDYGTVFGLWERMGGTKEAPLPQEAAFELARMVGSARVVRGSIVGDETNMVMHASIVGVPGGEVRSTGEVRGPYDQWLALAENLIITLLAGELGETAHRLPVLTEHPQEAVQEYLKGLEANRRGDSSAERHFDRALELDTTFVLAAVMKFAWAETDTAAFHFAWDRRDQLSSRDRSHLEALGGWRMGLHENMAQRIEVWTEIVREDPGDRGALEELGAWLLKRGANASIPEWRDRAREVLDRAIELDSAAASPLMNRALIAVLDRDTASLRQLIDLLDTVGPAYCPASTIYGLSLLFLGDTTEIGRILQGEREGCYPFGIATGGILIGDGLDEARAATRQNGNKSEAKTWGWYEEWEARRAARYAQWPPISQAAYRVRDALYTAPPDSLSIAAAHTLDRIARGDSTPSPPATEVAVAHCWSSLWRTSQGDTTGVRQAIEYLRTGVPLPAYYAPCAALLAVALEKTAGRDPGVALAHADSIIRLGPISMYPAIMGEADHDHTAGLENLLLARWLREAGETELALEAATRGFPTHPWYVWFHQGFGIDCLLEEARLHAALSDTTAAIDAYEHYLALREEADPPWRVQWDSARVEYTALTGEPDQ